MNDETYQDKSIVVVGLGYVGLPLALTATERGLQVVGFDINKEHIARLSQGKTHFRSADVTRKVAQLYKKIEWSADQKVIAKSDAAIICVPTPVDEHHKPDLKPLISATETVAAQMKSGQLVIVESTISPGTMEEVVLPILEKTGMKCGKDFNLAHCPERVDIGNKKFSLTTIPRVIGGITKECTERAARIYEQIIDAPITRLKTIKAAETSKIVENTFRDVNIALVNELARAFDAMGIDIMDVIRGASTKPFAFMAHYPGCGVGGHCFDKKTVVFIEDSNHHKIMEIGLYIDELACKKQVIDSTEIFYPINVKVLSYDTVKKITSFQPVTIATKRKTNNIIKIGCAYNYDLNVTDMHPVICYDNGLKIKFAKEVKIGDSLVLNKDLPSEDKGITIDIISYLNDDLIKKIRVKPKNTSFTKFRLIINREIKCQKRDYRNNSLPLSEYLRIESMLKIKRNDIFLCTGRGPSFKRFPAIFTLDEDFMRLMGYYLSEGCITQDDSLRIRFTFHRKEREYIDDVIGILKKFNLDYSVYHSKRFETSTIKVSSELFGVLLRDVLRCGTDCYSMQIPQQFFSMKKTLKEELLKGLFRGDGGVSSYYGKRKYTKNNRLSNHENNSIEVSYFTSSHVLFQQVVLWLLHFNIVPHLKKRKGCLLILGSKNVSIVKDWFLGDKQKKIQNYFLNMKKEINYRKTKVFDSFITITVENIKKVKTDCVYSMEVENTNTLITSNGIIAHNCIPVDPYYLIERSRENGFTHRFLSMARTINEEMPEYTVQRAAEALAKKGKKLENAEVAVLGLAYKAEIDDIRESPALVIIDILKKAGAQVDIYDPHVPQSSTKTDLASAIQDKDCIIIATDHNEFRTMSPHHFKNNNNIVIIDGRNCLNKEEFIAAGITYRGIGR